MFVKIMKPTAFVFKMVCLQLLLWSTMAVVSTYVDRIFNRDIPKCREKVRSSRSGSIDCFLGD